jgi:secreted PhoX family phosphatase
MSSDRRRFLQATAGAFAALAASGCMRSGLSSVPATAGYGPLQPDAQGLLDLPAGFSYRVISQLGDTMSDGMPVPDAADGMGCFDLGGGRLALVRNHELSPGQGDPVAQGPGYRQSAQGGFLAGGTTTLVLDARTLKLERQFRSLSGTVRNCAGGITPWGSWLTCEEPGRTLREAVDHGYVFEVPAAAIGPVEAVPLKAMGRFNHEAACVDPATGVIYMTEDQVDGLFYRFVPQVPGQLARGGKLQALALPRLTDSRNWEGVAWPLGGWQEARWVDLGDVEAPLDDLRARGAALGATLFARGEGLWMGEGELFFCCTSGGSAKLGQIFRLRPRAGGADQVQLFFESVSKDQFDYGDNLTISPAGHLVVCEDQYTDQVSNHLRWITPAGECFPLALNRAQSELAGACFSPDGKVLFVNNYSPTCTFAITGPWLG